MLNQAFTIHLLLRMAAHSRPQKYVKIEYWWYKCISSVSVTVDYYYCIHLCSNISTSSQEKDKEVKNERERVRIQKKNEALKVIKKLIMGSPLISEEAKKKRWTEVSNYPGSKSNITRQHNQLSYGTCSSCSTCAHLVTLVIAANLAQEI